MKDLLTGNLSNDIIKEINRPEKIALRKQMTKSYMLDFFERNLNGKMKGNGDIPTFLKAFNPSEEFDDGNPPEMLK